MKRERWALILTMALASMVIYPFLVLLWGLGISRLTPNELGFANNVAENWAVYGVPLVLLSYFIDSYGGVERPALKLFGLIVIELGLYFGAYVLTFANPYIPMLWFYLAAILTLFTGTVIKRMPKIA